MANCVNLTSIGAAASCVDYDNRGGILSKIYIGYHEDVGAWPTMSSGGDSGVTLAAAGTWKGNVSMKSGGMVEVNFVEGEGEISISLAGERGARCAHYELNIMRTKIDEEIMGLMNAFKDKGAVIIAVDANGTMYLMGDELVPAYMVEGDGAKTGRARTDRNGTTLNFEYYGQRFLIYDGDIPGASVDAEE